MTCDENQYSYSLYYDRVIRRYRPTNVERVISCPVNGRSLLLDGVKLKPRLGQRLFNFNLKLNVSKGTEARCIGTMGSLHFVYRDTDRFVHVVNLNKPANARPLYTGEFPILFFGKNWMVYRPNGELSGQWTLLNLSTMMSWKSNFPEIPKHITYVG